MHKLACPKCHKPIVQVNNSYKCENNHCYDIAKSKYLNLLLNPDKATNNPGDSKESLIARKAYLTKGYCMPAEIDFVHLFVATFLLEYMDFGLFPK